MLLASDCLAGHDDYISSIAAAARAGDRHAVSAQPAKLPVVFVVDTNGTELATHSRIHANRAQYWTRAMLRNSSGVDVPKPKNSRYAGIISNSMSVPTWTEHPLSSAACSSGVYSSFITTSPTKLVGEILEMSNGSGSPEFIPSGVALTMISKPSGSLEPVPTRNDG